MGTPGNLIIKFGGSSPYNSRTYTVSIDKMGSTSKHFDPDEIEVLMKIMGNDRISLSMGIAELAIAPPSNSETPDWTSVVKPGVVCLIEDKRKRGHYVQVFDMDKELRAWEHKIEPNMEYQRPKGWVITFKSAYCQGCLNFVFQEEADHFVNTLDKYLSPEVVQYPSNEEPSSDELKPRHTMSLSRKKFGGLNIKSVLNTKNYERLKTLLNVAGINEKVLDDPARSEQIYAFYEDYMHDVKCVNPKMKEVYGKIDYEEYLASGRPYDDYDDNYFDESPDKTARSRTISFPVHAPPPPPPPPKTRSSLPPSPGVTPPHPMHTIRTPQPLRNVSKGSLVYKPSDNTHDDSNGSHNRGDLSASVRNKILVNRKSPQNEPLTNLLQGALRKIKEANSDYGGVDLTGEGYDSWEDD